MSTVKAYQNFLLNQAQKFILCGLSVSMFVCPRLRLLITSDMIWTSYNWFKKFYSCYMATVVVIVKGYGLGIATHHTH